RARTQPADHQGTAGAVERREEGHSYLALPWRLLRWRRLGPSRLGLSFITRSSGSASAAGSRSAGTTGVWMSRTISWNSDADTAWPGRSGSVIRRAARCLRLGSTSIGPPWVATAYAGT